MSDRPRDGEVGIALQSDKPPGTYAALARTAEASGVDVVSVYADLGFQPPLPALLEIAAATSRVRVGPACVNPYLLHPVEIAGQIAALDLAADGRAYLGIAPGTWLDAVGVERRRPVRTVEEATAIVGALLRGDTGGVAGLTFRLEPGFALRYARRRSSVPVLVGAWGPALAAMAGRVADELKVGGSANPAMVAVMRDRVAVGARAASRDPDDIGIVLGAVSVVDEDGERARAIARTEVAMYLAVVAELDPTFRVPSEVLGRVRTLVDAGDHRRAGEAIPDEVLDRFSFSGTPEHVAGLVRDALDAGARRVDLGTPHGVSAEAGIELIGRRVLPLVRGERPAQAG